MAEARRGVWRLLQGDRRANLLAILEQPAPPESDEVLFKIHTPLRLGFLWRSAWMGLQALEQISWSTITIEQGHVSVS